MTICSYSIKQLTEVTDTLSYVCNLLKTDFHAHTRNIGDMVYWCVQYSIKVIKVTQAAFIVACFLATSYLDKSVKHHTTCMYVCRGNNGTSYCHLAVFNFYTAFAYNFLTTQHIYINIYIYICIYIYISRRAVVSGEAKKKQHAHVSSGQCDHYSELFARMDGLIY